MLSWPKKKKKKLCQNQTQFWTVSAHLEALYRQAAQQTFVSFWIHNASVHNNTISSLWPPGMEEYKHHHMALLDFQSLQQCLQGLHGLAMVVALRWYECLKLSYLLLLQYTQRETTREQTNWNKTNKQKMSIHTTQCHAAVITVTLNWQEAGKELPNLYSNANRQSVSWWAQKVIKLFITQIAIFWLYQETSSHATHQETLSNSLLSSPSHCGLILA